MNAANAPAGQRTILYQIRQGSIPIDFDFTVEPLGEGEPLEGELEITASSWIIPGTPQRIPLQARHQVRRGMWNTFFTLAIIPEIDVRITPVPRSAGGLSSFFVIILIIALIIVGAALFMFLGR